MPRSEVQQLAGAATHPGNTLKQLWMLTVRREPMLRTSDSGSQGHGGLLHGHFSRAYDGDIS